MFLVLRFLHRKRLNILVYKFMSGRRSRTKGHAFERWVAKKLRRRFPDAKRHLEYQFSEANGVDLVGTYPYLIQCKRMKRYASLAAISEVTIDPIEGGIPVLITKADRGDVLAALPFSEFLRLINK